MTADLNAIRRELAVRYPGALHEDAALMEVARLRDALRPFVWDDYDFAMMGHAPDHRLIRVTVTLGQMQAAREALKGEQG